MTKLLKDLHPEIDQPVSEWATVRSVMVTDAQALLDHIVNPRTLPDLNMGFDEFWPKTVEAEEEEIRKFLNFQNALFLVAHHPNTPWDILGYLTLSPRTIHSDSFRRADMHVARLGMHIDTDFTGSGLGSRMLKMAEYLIDAAPLKIRRIEAECYVSNVRGINFFLKHHFDVEGVRRKAALKDGEYINVLSMAKLLD